MILRFVAFFAVLTLVLGGATVLVHRRTSELLRLGPRGRRALAIALGFAFLTMLANRLLGRYLSAGVLEPPMTLGAAVALAVLLAAVVIGLFELGRFLIDLPARLRRRAAARSAVIAPAAAVERASESPAPPAPEPAPDLARRAFLTQAVTGSALLVGGSASAYGVLIGRHDYEIDEVPVPIPGLSRRLDGYTIAQLSDIHLGLFVGEAEMRAAEDLVRRARPDLVVLTGDLLDHDPRYAPMLGRLVRRLGPLARDGVAVISGNHDFYAGVDVTLGAAAEGGATVLRNAGRVIGGAGGAFALLGVDDVWGMRSDPGGGPDLDKAIASVPRDLPRVLLCHNPAFFPVAAGQVALQLSGHTHGGQVNLGVRPADLVLPYGYVAGMYQRAGSRLYVNRGFGTAGPPARVGAPPEVTRVVLVSA